MFPFWEFYQLPRRTSHKGSVLKPGWQLRLLVAISRWGWSWEITHTVTLGADRSPEPRAGKWL